MDPETFKEIVQLAAVLGGSTVGLFFVVKWMVQYQHNFTDRYIKENQELWDRVGNLEDAVQSAKAETETCETKYANLRMEFLEFKAMAAEERASMRLEMGKMRAELEVVKKPAPWDGVERRRDDRNG